MKTVIILLLSVATTWACNPITPISTAVEHIASGGCDCTYYTGGCKISQAAPPLLACKCQYDAPFTCSGRKTPCKDHLSLSCILPNTTLDSCLQGQGDCGGYDCKCGVPLAINSTRNKIVGGQNALLNEFPWQVLLTDGTNPLCSGILLSSRSILTSVECSTLNNPKITFASVGEYDRTNPPADVQRFPISPNSWTLHPDAAILMAIITLAGPVRFTPNVYPVCLPSLGSNYDYTEGVVSGWGLTEKATTTSYSNILQKLTETTMTNAVCKGLTSTASTTITETMICAAAAGNKGACTHDTGSPLITKNQNSGRYEVIGLAYKPGCDETDQSGADIYTRVTSGLVWIQKTIAGATCSG